MIFLRLLSHRHDRRTWLEAVLNADPELRVVCGGDEVDAITGHYDRGADVIVVDLHYPRAAESRFWSALHVYFSGARILALADQPIDPVRLEAALHAGAYYMLDWYEPVERFWRAARAAGSCAGFIPLGHVLTAMSTYFNTNGGTLRNFRFGDAELDLQRGEVIRGEQVIRLSNLEQALLVYLIGNAERPVATAELLQTVWHQSPESTQHREQVTSTIKRLRQKLEPDLAQPRYLLNRHGHGYYVPAPANP
jgi:DNA-binding response OmpR family regulator